LGGFLGGGGGALELSSVLVSVGFCLLSVSAVAGSEALSTALRTERRRR